MQPRPPSEKIKSLAELVPLFAECRKRGKRTVLTNGCFDLIHPGHVRYLQKARTLGDLLLVAVNGDRSVTRLKGERRPILCERDRSEVVASLESVDLVTIFREDTPAALIRSLLPSILVKGGDWPVDQIVGRECVEAAGGKVISIPFEEGYSTTKLIDRIRN